MTELTKADLEVIKLAKEIDYLDLQRIQLADDLDERVSSQDRAHVYTFAEDVSTESCAEAMVTLGEWHRMDPETAIEIIFSSPGGEVFAGFGLYDFIRDLVQQGAHVETRAVGRAASMAGILLQAGSTRSISANSWLLIHEVSSYGGWQTLPAMADDLALCKRLARQCLVALSERSTLTIAEIKARSARKDWWLDAREAKKYGFVDVIR